MPRNQSVKHHLRLILKILISTSLLVWLLSMSDIQDGISHISTLAPIYVIVAFLLAIVGLFISAEKWHVLLDSMDQRPSFLALLRLLWIGAFFNNFLPGRTGGDIIRVYGITSSTQNRSQAITSVVVDRGLNLIALIFIAWVALIIAPNILPKHIHALLITGSSLLLLASFAGFLYVHKSSPQKATKITWLQQIITSIKNITIAPNIFFKTSVLSLLYQTTVILSNYSVAKSLHIALDPWVFFYAIPVTALITMIPISLNGFGLREGAYALIFVPLGISTTSAISISLIATGCMMALSLIGGIFYMFGSVRLSPNAETLTHKPSNV